MKIYLAVLVALFSGAIIADDSMGPIPERSSREYSRPFSQTEFPRPYYEMPDGLRDFMERPSPYGRSYYREYHYESYGPGPRSVAPTYPVPQQRPPMNWHPIFGNDGSRVTSVDGTSVPQWARYYSHNNGRIVFSR